MLWEYYSHGTMVDHIFSMDRRLFLSGTLGQAALPLTPLFLVQYLVILCLRYLESREFL